MLSTLLDVVKHPRWARVASRHIRIRSPSLVLFINQQNVAYSAEAKARRWIEIPLSARCVAPVHSCGRWVGAE
jgi:hypothetical protein